jgi:type II secretory pathway pseudopilin PulG
MRRLRAEDGMTLIEMLIAMVVAMIVSLAAFGLVDFTMHRAGEITGRVDASERGRIAMDMITRQLRSQVCQTSGTRPMAAAADTTASFYVDFTDGSTGRVPDLHTLSYVAPTGTQRSGSIVERDYAGTAGKTVAQDPTYATVPFSTSTLATNVIPVDGVPVLRYFAYNSTTPLKTPVTGAAALATIARVRVTFRAMPGRDTSRTGSVVIQDDVVVRGLDPNPIATATPVGTATPTPTPTVTCA